MIRFTAQPVQLDAQAGTGRRTITGIAVPYGVEATVGNGMRVVFEPGSLPEDGPAPKLIYQHDAAQPVGLVTGRAATDEGMLFSARLSDTAAGRDAMTLLADGVIDSVSIGAEPLEHNMVGAVMHVTAARWLELSLVTIPAFAAAKITSIAASEPDPQPDPQPEPEEVVMSDTETIIPTAVYAAAPRREPRLPSAASYMAAMHAGGDAFVEAQRVWADYRDWHADPIQAAAGDEVLSNIAGLVPVPILGPVFEDLKYIAPVLSALGTRAMPSNGAGATFIRPTWTTHPTVAQQSTELTAVSATTAVVASNTVTKVTFAGSAQMSYQTLDFSDPALLQIMLQDLSGVYLDAIDNYAADNLLTAATSAGVWDLTVVDLLKSIYDAAVVTAATNFLPTHIFVDPATWGLFGQLVDGSNRPIFPSIGLPGVNGVGGNGSASNYGNMNPLGLQLVVDKNFAAKTMVIINEKAFEIYRQDRGVLSVESPTTLGRTVSVFGYAATFKANAAMIQKITQA